METQIAITGEIEVALKNLYCIVAIGVSGGKDSTAVALATCRYLDEIGYRGRIVLIHSDLGMTEWEDSLPSCQRLAAHLGLELIVTRRAAGGMMERWEGRWQNNLTRYRELSCVKLTLPWSTASMRFCTSELKVAPITSALKKRFPGHVIVNVTGVRRDESCGRKNTPVSKPNVRLKHKRITEATGQATSGYDWCPIACWDEAEVWEVIDGEGLKHHEAYATYGMSRVSCVYCILSNQCDLRKASKAGQTHDLYRRMVKLESDSTFSFQGGKWLADVNPDLLSDDEWNRSQDARSNAEAREMTEREIPVDMLYVKGWPHREPTWDEAVLLARVRRDVAQLVGITDMECTTAESVINRYRELLAAKELKGV